LPYRDTDQVRVCLWFIDFSRSYSPMDLEKYHKFSVFHTFFLRERLADGQTHNGQHVIIKVTFSSGEL
jgi:hypothetical protein